LKKEIKVAEWGTPKKFIKKVRFSTEGCLTVLFKLGNEKPFWIDKANIKYDMTVSICNPAY
jgi:hypothetical protein